MAAAGPIGIITLVQQAASKKLLFLPHAVRQMSLLDRMISVAEVRSVITEGKMIEDYPNDPRGHSCLILGRGDRGRSVHVVCAPKEDFLAIITAYLPSKDAWRHDFRERRKS